MAENRGHSAQRAVIFVTREDAALLHAAASLAEFSEPRRQAAHLAGPLRALAERIAACLPPERAAA